MSRFWLEAIVPSESIIDLSRIIRVMWASKPWEAEKPRAYDELLLNRENLQARGAVAAWLN